jgi:hypothetical protein
MRWLAYVTVTRGIVHMYKILLCKPEVGKGLIKCKHIQLNNFVTCPGIPDK